MIKTIFWKNNAVVLIDQKALPLAEKYIVCKSYKAVIACIKDLTVRGAPAIGVAAAMGAALGAIHLASLSPDKFGKSFTPFVMRLPRHAPRHAIFSGRWSA